MPISNYGLRLTSVIIDADGSPSGYVAWYNYSTETGKIRILRPYGKNDRYAVQRMEMLAIYFALADNQRQIKRMMTTADPQKKKQVVVNVRSDSKTSIEQLQGMSEVRDTLMQRIYAAIRKLLERMSSSCCVTIFNHLERAKNIAGLLLEQRRRKEEEKLLMCQQGDDGSSYKNYYYYHDAVSRLDALLADLYNTQQRQQRLLLPSPPLMIV